MAGGLAGDGERAAVGAAAGLVANPACIYSVVFTVNFFNLLCIELAGRCPPCLLMAGHSVAFAARPLLAQMHRMPAFLGPSVASFLSQAFVCCCVRCAAAYSTWNRYATFCILAADARAAGGAPGLDKRVAFLYERWCAGHHGGQSSCTMI